MEAGFRIEIVDAMGEPPKATWSGRPFDRVTLARIAIENLAQYRNGLVVIVRIIGRMGELNETLSYLALGFGPVSWDCPASNRF